MTRGDYRALAAELRKPDLVGLSVADATASLNATVSAPAPGAPRVAVADLQRLAFERGILGRLLASGSPDAASAVSLLRDSRFPTIDISGLAFVAATAGLVEQSLLTVADLVAIQGLATIQTTRAQLISGWGLPVTEADVEHARTL